MSADSDSKLLERLRRQLEECPEVELAVLFGSAGRHLKRADSDIDVGVLIRGSGAAARHRLEASLGRTTGRTVDLILLDEAPPLLRFEIARDGVLLLERRAHGWADFRVRAMHDWWDWAPLAQRLHEAAIRRLRDRAAIGQSSS